jgi:hypothetical protein
MPFSLLALSKVISPTRAAAKAICDIVCEWHGALEGARRCGREAEDALSKAQQRLRRAMERRNTMHLRHVPASEGYFGERSEGSGPGQDNVWFHVPATMTGEEIRHFSLMLLAQASNLPRLDLI